MWAGAFTRKKAYCRGHVLGNLLFTRSVEWLFGPTFTDILSSYRVFSRAFVQSFPTASRGFEIETELTAHALTLSLPGQEPGTAYKSRPEGSVSKLHTYRDGWRISLMILRLFRTERPQLFYTLIGCALCGLILDTVTQGRREAKMLAYLAGPRR